MDCIRNEKKAHKLSTQIVVYDDYIETYQDEDGEKEEENCSNSSRKKV
jgi:hypothetical protein